jgi:hypothetical protein
VRYDTNVKPLAVPLAALALAAALAGRGAAQTAPPGTATPGPWHVQPVIIVDPRPYLGTRPPSAYPAAKRRATPHRRSTVVPPARRTPSPARTVETFERIDTSPGPGRPPR